MRADFSEQTKNLEWRNETNEAKIRFLQHLEVMFHVVEKKFRKNHGGTLILATSQIYTFEIMPNREFQTHLAIVNAQERCEQNYVRSWLPRKAGTLTDSQHISPMFFLWTVCWLAYNCQLLEPESMKVKAQPLQRHFAWTRLGSRCAIFCQILPSRIGSAYFDMAKFRYLRTFIDEESSHGVVLSRTPSCPNLGVQIADKEEEQWLSDYVTGLEFKSQTLTPVLPAQEIPEEMPVVPEVEGDQVHQLQIQSDADAATLPVGNGSRGHPFLCRRPCVRLAKGNCHMGDACGYCHHQTHHRFASLDKRQRVHLHSMDTCFFMCYSNTFLISGGKNLGTLKKGTNKSFVRTIMVSSIPEEFFALIRP